MRLVLEEISSPLGPILLASHAAGVCALDFADCRERMEELLGARFGAVEFETPRSQSEAARRVESYLGGELDAFEGVALDTQGTPFQERVWAALRTIPAGATRSYGEIARALGRPTASRAVGAANGRNPVALAVPCHRVIGADGSLTGYAGGVARKRWLLEHEGVRL
jgi:methylated-DNA-[protein]-cysteine S-methyltransferase